MEAAGLGVFMISACTFAILIFWPHSPIAPVASGNFLRRMMMGVAMGATAMAIIYSPWGKQSGAHLNPAVTLTFWRLGKVEWPDAVFYTISQSLGGTIGVLFVSLVAPQALQSPEVRYIATVPGTGGVGAAWFVEFTISVLLMTVVLTISNAPRYAAWTGLAAGLVVAFNIVVADPWSGMSMNPARSLASAIPSGIWTGFWIYLTAPPLAMLFAAQVYVRLRRRGRGLAQEQGRAAVHCAKLHHDNRCRCIFCGKKAKAES